MEDPAKLTELLNRIRAAESPETMALLLTEVFQSVDPAIVVEGRSKAVRKNAAYWMVKYTDILNASLAAGDWLIRGRTLKERNGQYVRMVANAERLWLDAVALYRAQSYASSTALAISAIEETGKLSVCRFQLVLEPPSGPTETQAQRQDNPLYSHSDKHFLAAAAGAAVNARLDRILGEDAIIRFLRDVRKRRIEPFRQSCLYIERRGGALHIPSEKIQQETARFYVVLAGELLAEILGFEPSEWERLLELVKQFEREEGIPPD